MTGYTSSVKDKSDEDEYDDDEDFEKAEKEFGFAEPADAE
jgi:hypothetical protein